MMTKKDYVILARALARSHTCVIVPGTATVVRHVAREVAYELALDNPRFDASRFMDAVFHLHYP